MKPKGTLKSSMNRACLHAYAFKKPSPAVQLTLIVKEPERRGAPLGKILEDNGYEANRLYELNYGSPVRKRHRRISLP